MGTSDAGPVSLHEFTLAVFDEKMCVRSQPRSGSAPCPVERTAPCYKSLGSQTFGQNLDFLEALATRVSEIPISIRPSEPL